jgi:hypothetical protein
MPLEEKLSSLCLRGSADGPRFGETQPAIVELKHEGKLPNSTTVSPGRMRWYLLCSLLKISIPGGNKD